MWNIPEEVRADLATYIHYRFSNDDLRQQAMAHAERRFRGSSIDSLRSHVKWEDHDRAVNRERIRGFMLGIVEHMAWETADAKFWRYDQQWNECMEALKEQYERVVLEDLRIVSTDALPLPEEYCGAYTESHRCYGDLNGEPMPQTRWFSKPGASDDKTQEQRAILVNAKPGDVYTFVGEDGEAMFYTRSHGAGWLELETA